MKKKKPRPSLFPLCTICGRGMRNPSSHGLDKPYCGAAVTRKRVGLIRSKFDERGYANTSYGGSCIAETPIKMRRVPCMLGDGINWQRWAPKWAAAIATLFNDVSIKERRRMLIEALEAGPERQEELRRYATTVKKLGRQNDERF